MEINDVIHVIDKKDKKPYPCKIVGANQQDKRIKIHFIDWSDSYDEWIPLDSNRIVEENSHSQIDHSEDSPEPASTHEKHCEEIIGRLLMNGNDIHKKVISTFKHDENLLANEKRMSKFQVPMLEETAEYLKVAFEDCNGKKLYPKPVLVKKIINRLYSTLPVVCADCNDTYAGDLNEEPLFSCQLCDRGAHNCDQIKQFKASLPKTIPKGFVWICPTCSGFTVTEVATKPSIPSKAPTQPGLDLSVVQTNSTLADQTSKPDLTIINASQNTKICPRYKRGICPHGLRGNKLIEGKTCSFDHPRACRKYSSFGSRGHRGCKRGSNCKFYHPVLCRYSVRDRLCTNENCTFVHLKGTKRRKDNDFIPTEINSAPKLTGGNNTAISPKNDLLDKIGAMIKDLKISQETEINKMKQELNYMKGMNMHPRWSPVVSPWQIPYQQGYHAQTLPPSCQSVPVLPQVSAQVPTGTQTRVGQQMGGLPPGGTVAPPSCY